jgi:hypothetical protein
MYGIYSKSQNECKASDAALMVRNGKVYRGGRHVRFPDERTALIWAEAKCKEFFVQRIQ